MRHLVILLLVMQIVAAVPLIGTNKTNANSLFIQIASEIDINASNQAEAEVYLRQNSIIVIGEDVSLTESMLLQAAKMQNRWLGGVEEIEEADFDVIEGCQNHKLIILLGGPSQNSISKLVKDNGWLNESYQFEGGITVETGTYGETAIVMVSDTNGYEAIQKQIGVEYSPLNGIVPKEYIPAAATGISVILLALINVGRTVFEFKALDIGRKGKKVGEGALIISGINISEVVAIFGASLVLGISLSWQFFGPTQDFFKWVLINSAICLAGAIIHEVSHKIIALLFKIKVEYKFWPAGSILTLISSYLGNAFSIQGFVLEEIEPNTAKWKVGVMKLAGPTVSAIIMVIFACLNFFDPSPVYKIIYSTSALWAMAEMLPFSGLDGKDIKEWNNFVWFVAFSLIGAAYVVVTFVL